MSRALSILIILFIWSKGAYSQSSNISNVPPSKLESVLPKYYLAAGSGFQYKYGVIGIGFGYRLTNTSIVEFNAGMGAYAPKVGLTAIFNSGNSKAWCPFIGFSRVDGILDKSMLMEIEYNNKSYKVDTRIFIDPVVTVNAGMQKQYVTKNGNRFTIDIGYAIGITKQVYGLLDNQILIDNKLVNKTDLDFSSDQKKRFKVFGPSGLTIGFSYNFGL